MKRIAIFGLLAVCSLTGWSQQVTDPVLMTVAGREVTRGEFEYSLNKNYESPSQVSEQDIKEYVDLYVNYRMKVQAALDAKMDTLSSFQKEYRTYRDVQLKPFVYDSLYADSIVRNVYDNIKVSVGDSDLVKVSHIMIYVPQNADAGVVDAAKVRIDSIYAALQGGADFAELAKKCSDDKGTAVNGGELPWIGPAQVIPEFRDAAWALRVGQMSKPVLTAAGYHVIYMNDRKKLEPYEEKRAEIQEQLDRMGLREDAAEHMIARMVSESGGSMSREDVLLQVQAKAVGEKPELKYLINEYYDGLLLYEASNRLVWQEAASDEAGLNRYFQANKAKYQWKEPHFRGYTYRTKSKVMAKQIAKLLKGCKADEGLELLKQKLPADSVKAVRVHFGVWKKGDNALVDYLKFKTGKEPKQNKVLPFYGVVGKVQKQPKEVIDVKSQVVSDYQAQKEAEWIDGLRKRYPFTVDEAVLATVNKH
ncbi:MAG: peptidylprolyl isomerase [Bacteroidaceae bacterium]|nr:peptidylprolyl isomerase [Bacteroidaceae bacterium]